MTIGGYRWVFRVVTLRSTWVTTTPQELLDRVRHMVWNLLSTISCVSSDGRPVSLDFVRERSRTLDGRTSVMVAGEGHGRSRRRIDVSGNPSDSSPGEHVHGPRSPVRSGRVTFSPLHDNPCTSTRVGWVPRSRMVRQTLRPLVKPDG